MSELSKFIVKPTYHKIKLLDDRSIGVRTWKMAEEKDFLFAIESRKTNDEDVNKNIHIEESIALAKKCVDKPDLVDKLSEANLIYLLAELRKLAKGSIINLTYYCLNPECPDYIKFTPEQQKETGIPGRGRELQETSLDITSADMIITRFDNTPIKIGDFKYYIQEVPFNTRKTLNDKYFPTFELSKWNYYFVIESISAIEPPGEKKITKIPYAELMEFIDNQLDKKQFKELSDKIAGQLSKFKIEKTVTCPLCRSEAPIIYDEIFSLMVF